MAQTDFSTTTKDLLSNVDNNFKGSLKETIADQDEQFDEELEKHIQTLSLQIKEEFTKFSLKWIIKTINYLPLKHVIMKASVI